MKRVILIAFLGLSLLPYEFINGMDVTKEVKIDARDSMGDTALHRATKEGDVSKIQSLLNQGANPNLQDQWGYSAFCKIIRKGDLTLVKECLKHGAKKNPDGLRTVTTPLIEACREFCKDSTNEERLAIINLLLEGEGENKGADPNMRPDGYGDTAIDIAIENQNLDLLKLLFKHGAMVDTWSGTVGSYPLHSAVRTGNNSIIRFLLDKGANPNVTDARKRTALHLAAVSEDKKILQLLLDNGGDPKALDYKQNTPLHDAKNAEIVKILLQKDVDINAKNADGETPLHVAARNENSDIIQVLVDSGADKTVANKKGDTPLVVAIYEEAKERLFDINILNQLCSEETKLSYNLVGQAIYTSAARGNNELLEFILSKTSDFKGEKGRGISALCIAIKNQELKGAEILIKHGVDLNARASSFDGETPLHLAVSEGDIDAMKLLLKHGAQINVYGDWYNNTPVDEALKYKPKTATNMVKIMLESQGVDVKSQEAVSKYMQTNFEHERSRSGVISLLFPKKSERKVTFQFL